MMLTNWQAGSSRRKASTWRISDASTLTVSSPWASETAVTVPGRAELTRSPICLSASVMRRSGIGGCSCLRPPPCLPLDRAGAPDLLLQQEDAVEQRLGRGRAARHVDVDRHDAVAAAHHGIGIV